MRRGLDARPRDRRANGATGAPAVAGASARRVGGHAVVALLTVVAALGCQSRESVSVIAPGGLAGAPAKVPTRPTDGGGGAVGGDGGSGDAGVHRRPTLPSGTADVDSGDPVLCGDGVRDPDTEECDDGNTSSADACTNDCRVHDVVVWPNPDPSATYPRHGHALGYGQNAVTSSTAVIAVAAHDLDTGGIAIHAFDAHGGDTLTNRSPAMPASVHPADEPDAAIACADTVCAAVWTDLDVDGEDTGIAVARFDAANAGAGVTYRAANTTVVGAQQKADITWTGTAFVVAWQDESNEASQYPYTATPVVKHRTFDRDLNPTSSETVTFPDNDSQANVTATSQAGQALLTFVEEHPYGDSYTGYRSVSSTGVSWTFPSVHGPEDERPAVVSLADGSKLVGSTIYFVDDAQVQTGDTAPAFVGLQRMTTAGTYGTPSWVLLDVSNPVHGVSVATGASTTWLSYLQANDEVAYLSAIDPDALALTGSPLPLRRSPTAAGPMRRAHLVSAATGDAMIAVWDDLGHQGDVAEGDEDVELEILPLPLLRLPPASP